MSCQKTHVGLEVGDGLRDAGLQVRAEVLELGAARLLQLLGDLHAPARSIIVVSLSVDLQIEL